MSEQGTKDILKGNCENAPAIREQQLELLKLLDIINCNPNLKSILDTITDFQQRDKLIRLVFDEAQRLSMQCNQEGFLSPEAKE